MKRLFLILTAGLLIAGTGIAHAQSVTPKDKQGDRALVFSINGFGDFGITGVPAGQTAASTTGGPETSPILGAGVRMFMSDRMAVRVNVGLGMTTEKSDTDTLTKPETTTTTFGIAPGIEIHMMNAGPVSAYVGGQVAFGSTSTTSKRTIAGTTSESSTSGSVFAIQAILGAEFFPWSNISFGAEYLLGFSTASTSSESGGTSTDGPTRTHIGIGSAAVNCSVFF